MSIADIKDVLETSSSRIAGLVLLSSIVFMLPNSLFSALGLGSYHNKVMSNYGTQIFIALVVSFILVLFHACFKLSEFLRNRTSPLKIIKATYGTDKFHTIDVTDRVKKRIERKGHKVSLKFIVDDGVLLAIGKKDDPVPGSDKSFWIEYCYKHTEKYEKGEPVEISDERWQRERDRLKTPAV